ncbi:hypothetical protein CANCADRAFT_18571, partial [Tortispora caseinolytica NRRL Y-17796]
ERNRYADIVPFVDNRVILQHPIDNHDYINASHISLASPNGTVKKYIATQGPKRNTASHFWWMIAHHTSDPATIVMLTPLEEGPIEKCYKYWPDSSSIDIGHGGSVYFVSKAVDESSTAVITQLSLKFQSPDGATEIQKTVNHIHFCQWPDFSRPQGERLVLNLIETVNSYHTDPSSPLVVHCSAGVGRTGTYIAASFIIDNFADLYIAHKDLDFQDTVNDPVFQVVSQLRAQRAYMVMNLEQYEFIYH